MKPPPSPPARQSGTLVTLMKVLLATIGGFIGLILVMSLLPTMSDGGGDEGGRRSGNGQACSNAFATAAAVPGLDADAELERTLVACSDYDEWLAGLRAEPGALGLTERATIGGPMEVANFCHGVSHSTPVCDDARDRGIIE